MCKRRVTSQESNSDDDVVDDDADAENVGDDMDSQMSINHFIMEIHD